MSTPTPRQVLVVVDDDNIIVKDLLYGIGLCLDEKKYKNADGFRKFVAFLRGKIL